MARFLMMCDERFHNSRSGAYTSNPFLEYGLREFGGYDNLLLWHASRRFGVDDRNPFGYLD